MSNTPISVTINSIEGEPYDLLTIRFIQTILDNYLSSDDMAKVRVLQYLEQKTHDRIMKESVVTPIGNLRPGSDGLLGNNSSDAEDLPI